MKEYCAFNAIDGTILCVPNKKKPLKEQLKSLPANGISIMKAAVV